jgi:hypothetical protein
LREKVVVVWKALLHSAKIPSEEIFAAKDMHSWKVIDSLVRLHAIEAVTLNGSIAPKYVPIFLI